MIGLNTINTIQLPWQVGFTIHIVRVSQYAESIEHFFSFYKISSDFWKHVLLWLKENRIYIGILKESDMIFGKFNIKHFFINSSYFIIREILHTLQNVSKWSIDGSRIHCPN